MKAVFVAKLIHKLNIKAVLMANDPQGRILAKDAKKFKTKYNLQQLRAEKLAELTKIHI